MYAISKIIRKIKQNSSQSKFLRDLIKPLQPTGFSSTLSCIIPYGTTKGLGKNKIPEHNKDRYK